jgi:ribosomal-protein-alanine N-acetyltransferase
MSQGPAIATLSHAPVLAAIHAAAFPANEAWSSDVFLLQIEAPGSFGLLDEAGGMTVARVIADEAEIVTLAVIPEMRRRGMAARLLRAAMAEAAKRGATRIFLEVDVANVGAKALYNAAGFVEVGRRRKYYANGADAAVMRAELTPDLSSPQQK